jgi:outer membrane lipoprotein-sorting protein
MSFKRILSQGGRAMTVAPRISLLLILLTLFGCASQLQRPQTSQAVAEKMQEEQQSKKTAIPTITYRPGG